MTPHPVAFPEERDPAAERQQMLRLVAGIGAGDVAAEAEMAEQFQRRVLVMMVVRTRDQEAARDLAQETLMAVLAALRKGQLREAEKLPAFVHGIARNLLNSFFRERGRRPAAIELSPEIASFEPPDELEGAERSRALREGLDQLEPDDRKILLLTLVDGLKPREIARRLGLSAEVVRTRKSRALKRLVEHMRAAMGPGQAPPVTKRPGRPL
jgi:RNA polymerase sigma-70 factor (ECF subfamily)